MITIYNFRGFLRKSDTSKAIELLHLMTEGGISADSYTKSLLVDLLSSDGRYPSPREKLQNHV